MLASNIGYGLAILAIGAFCFWKPNFPRLLAHRAGIRNKTGTTVFLVVYWFTIPVIIHRLMAQIQFG